MLRPVYLRSVPVRSWPRAFLGFPARAAPREKKALLLSSLRFVGFSSADRFVVASVEKSRESFSPVAFSPRLSVRQFSGARKIRSGFSGGK